MADSTSTRTFPNPVGSRRRMIQNYLVIWVDNNIDLTNEDCQKTLEKLQNVVTEVNLCTTSAECMKLLNDLDDGKAFVICSGVLGQNLMSHIHNMTCVDVIYIFCGNKPRHEVWAKQWPKIQGVFTSIKPICESLKKVARECDHDIISMSFVPKQTMTTTMSSQEELKRLPPSFMYSVLFKEIILEINEDDEKAVKDLVTYCYHQNILKSQVKYFENDYHKHTPIWWYTDETFLYGMLNKALRSLDMEGMTKMGFFIRKLHQQLEQLHKEQSTMHEKQFDVYRGQGLTEKDFESLRSTKGGLLSFNNFLSTSKDPKIAMGFVGHALHKCKDIVGVLFIMTIDSSKISVSTTPFALIDDYSAIPQEQEILFSMHTVFRVDDIKQTVDNNRLWEVQLTLTDENDPQLAGLTQNIRHELLGSTGWHKLGNLLIKTGDFQKAEEVYLALLRDVSDDDKKEKSFLYCKLGLINYNISRFIEAEQYLQLARKIQENILPENDPQLAKTYNIIGSVCMKLGKNSEALRYFKKSVEINESLSPQDNHQLAINYKNIGTVYSKLGKYTESLLFYKKSLEFNEKIGLTISPELASCYTNIGSIYLKTKQYEEALEFYMKALDMNEKTHTPHHRHVANCYSLIGSLYGNMGKYSEACSYLQKALDMLQNSPHHSHLASCYRNFGLVYGKMGQYKEALSNFEKAVLLFTSISAYHPKLAGTLTDIGTLYGQMENYSQERSYHERARDTYLSEEPPNYDGVANSCYSLGMVYTKMEQYEKALLFYQRALENGRKIYDEDDPVLQMYRENIAAIQNRL